MRTALVILLGGVGVFFSLSGAVGILRMPDVYTRIQCASKSVTMGALPLLGAVVVAKGLVTPFASRALMIAFLLLVVNPMASQALARAAYKSGIEQWSGAVSDVPRQRRDDGGQPS